MKTVKIGNRTIGEGYPCFVIAELSANHNQDINKAKRLIRIAKECGADAVKLQTYTPDTLTIDCDNEYFSIKSGAWKGQTLYNLYQKAFTPWEWYPELLKVADEVNIVLFSSAFDKTAVDFLESMNTPAYKIASFELIDIPLVRFIASKGKPILISTGMSNEGEIQEALNTIQGEGNEKIILLKCTSAYPALPQEMNLSAIPYLARIFNVPVGISDHSITEKAATTSVAIGAKIVEKHFIENRKDGGPDSHFSIEPNEFKNMVMSIREIEMLLGQPSLLPTAQEEQNIVFRKSLFAVEDIQAGDYFSDKNIRVIRPGFGLLPKYLEQLLGKKSKRTILRGNPLTIDDFE